MSYALVVSNAIQSEGPLPLSARRLDTQQWVMGLATAPADLQQACGYFAVQDTARPADTPTQTFTRSLALVAAVPTVTWTARNKTQTELDAATAAANDATLRSEIDANVATLLTSVATLNTLTATTNATINANPAQYIKDVARECKTVARQAIRLAYVAIGKLDSTNSGS